MHVNMLRDVEPDALRAMLGNVPMAAAVTRDGQHPRVLRNLSACAVIVGSEAHGVRPDILSMCAHTVTIPGSDSVESLNASIACAVLMYEAQ